MSVGGAVGSLGVPLCWRCDAVFSPVVGPVITPCCHYYVLCSAVRGLFVLHSAVAFMISDMAIGIEAARNMTWKAAWLHDAGKRNTQ